jgi:hypothetical protein
MVTVTILFHEAQSPLTANDHHTMAAVILKHSFTNIGCPNKNAGFELRAIVLVLGWQHWLYKFCALCLFRLVAMERFTTEQ